MAVCYVDGIEVELADDERINGIVAARRAGVEIPHYCWHPGLSVVASCRMCLVQTGMRDAESGEDRMLPKLVPACQTPARDGAVFVTKSQTVTDARARVEEALLIDHPIDCPICDKAGECHLQDYHFEHGQPKRRADIRPFSSRRRDMGDTVSLFVDRCVMCSRCVRFTREVSGTAELMVVNRGSHEEIDVFPGFPLDNKLSGNVVDLCPVGALGDKDFLYQQRVWFMKSRPGVCTGCSTGCSIFVEENQNQVYRLKPRENAHVNDWWMCDDGRYGYKHVNDPARLTTPLLRNHGDGGGNGDRADVANETTLDWQQVPELLVARLRGAGGRLAAVLSPHQTVEEAYLLAKLIRGIDPEAALALGPVPVAGDDVSFPAGFTIRAEKCPNRRGIEMLLSGLGGSTPAFETLADKCASGEIGGVWITGGYPQAWIDAPLAAKFAAAELVIVQDLFDSPLAAAATVLLPATSFAERDGSYVNVDGRLQSAEWAIQPPGGVLLEARLYWRMLERPGLYRARHVLDEIAAEISGFAAAETAVPAEGVELVSKPTARNVPAEELAAS